jgi:hypothetical protein
MKSPQTALSFYQIISDRILKSDECEQFFSKLDSFLLSESVMKKDLFSKDGLMLKKLKGTMNNLKALRDDDGDELFFTSKKTNHEEISIALQIILPEFLMMKMNSLNKGDLHSEFMLSVKIQRASMLKASLGAISSHKKLSDLKEYLSGEEIANIFTQIGYCVGCLEIFETFEQKSARKLIHSLESSFYLNSKRWHKHTNQLNEAKEIARSKYEAGDRRFHNEVAKEIHNFFLKRCKKENKSLENEIELLEKKIPSIESIMKSIKSIADEYGCVRGKKGVTKQ